MHWDLNPGGSIEEGPSLEPEPATVAAAAAHQATTTLRSRRTTAARGLAGAAVVRLVACKAPWLQRLAGTAGLSGRT